MLPIEFKQHIIEDVLTDEGLSAHPELVERLSRFVRFDEPTPTSHSVSKDAIEFPLVSGLPFDSPPFLSFEAYSQAQLTELYDLYDMPKTIFPLGHNGSGDTIEIELSFQEIVYLNHDCDMQRVFINSSVAQFAESLFWYRKFLKQRHVDELLAKLHVFDLAAAAKGTMWQIEAAIDPYLD